MRAHVPWLWLIAGIGMLVAGCDSLPTSYIADDGQVLPELHNKTLVAAENPPLPDVPVPEGFVVIGPRSKTYVDGGTNVTEQVYQGRARLLDTIGFYRAQLRAKGWQPAGEQTDNPDSVLMQHTRSGQTLVLRLADIKEVSTVFVRLQDRAMPPLAPGRPTPTYP